MAKKDNIIAPSILSADFAKLGEEVESVLSAGADWVHFDVMDNHYVPNLTIGPMVCSALREYGIKAPIDVHLMVQPVDRLIDDFVEAGATYITFHPEASQHIDRSLQIIKSGGCKSGLVLNPASSINLIEDCLESLDMILLMSVNPGFGGQKFIPSVLNKLRKLRKIIDDNNLDIRLEIDGGVKLENISEISEAGADTFVAGSAIFSQNNYEKVISEMRSSIK
jgi:ribulose-phosphate 3-epimerase